MGPLSRLSNDPNLNLEPQFNGSLGAILFIIQYRLSMIMWLWAVTVPLDGCNNNFYLHGLWGRVCIGSWFLYFPFLKLNNGWIQCIEDS